MSRIGVAALVFDVQGTLLDFFGPVSRALREALASKGIDHDPASLTNAWRRSYFTGTRAVTEGGRDFVATATIYREGLDAVLGEAGLDRAFSDAERDALNAAWTHLQPWPDTVEGLRRLRRRHVLAALSNGGMAATIDMAARHDLGFHTVLTGELVRSFKPDPSLYRLAIASLGRPPETLMMVASHPYDLEAAQSHGMRTAFVERPFEFGHDTPNTATAPVGTDIVATDILDLARQLGAS